MSRVMKSAFGESSQFWTEIPAEIYFRDLICGGKPQSAEVYLDHLRRQTGITNEVELRRLYVIDLQESGAFDEDVDVDEIMENLTEKQFYDLVQEAAKKYEVKALTGFFKDKNGRPYIENYQVLAAIKEAVNVQYAGKKWGKTNKGPKNYAAERIAISPRKIFLGKDKIDGIKEITGKVSGATGPRQVISRYEYVEGAKINFIVMVPKNKDISGEFTPDVWRNIWLYLQENGIGAARSTGHGTFTMTRFGDLLGEVIEEDDDDEAPGVFAVA